MTTGEAEGLISLETTQSAKEVAQFEDLSGGADSYAVVTRRDGNVIGHQRCIIQGHIYHLTQPLTKSQPYTRNRKFHILGL